jgi:splicing factor 3B subunit 4
MAQQASQRNAASTVYVGNLEEEVTEDLLWELMLQSGPIESVFFPRDKVTLAHQGYGFVEYKSEEDAEYSMRVMNMVKLFGRGIKVQSTSGADRSKAGGENSIGANLFIGGLNDEVDEKLLHDTFGAFGAIVQEPKIAYDDNGLAKGFGFVAFDSFEAADLAVSCMHGQYLGSKQITVQYAFKKDSPGERHGSQAERLIASGRSNTSGGPRFPPNQYFSTGGKDAGVDNVTIPAHPQMQPRGGGMGAGMDGGMPPPQMGMYGGMGGGGGGGHMAPPPMPMQQMQMQSHYAPPPMQGQMGMGGMIPPPPMQMQYAPPPLPPGPPPAPPPPPPM